VGAVSDGREAGGSGARRAAPGGRRRRTEKPPYARLEAELAAARQENAGLKQQVEAQRRRLSDALEQQTATADILRVIASSPTDLQPVLDAVAERAAGLCDARDAQIYRVVGGLRQLAAHYGPGPSGPLGRTESVDRALLSGRAIIERRTIHVHDLAAVFEADDGFPAMASAVLGGFRTMLCTPLLREGRAVGAILIRRQEVRPFTDQQVALLESFANQAVIALENARLFSELQESNRTLTEALEQQTATAEILQAISRSPTDVQAVLDAVVVSASRLCDSWPVAVLIREGDRLRRRAQVNERGGAVQHQAPVPSWTEGLPIVPGWLAGRAVLEGRTVHVSDMVSPEGDEYPVSQEMARAAGWRAMVAIPLLQRGDAVGVLYVVRLEARPFSDQEIALLQTFADQAVIAIENARLFHELQNRNRELQEALEQQTATGEVLSAISRAPTDLQQVLDTIAESAARLCATDDVVIFRLDQDGLQAAAHYGSLPPPPATLPVEPGWVSSRAVIERRTIHVHDLLALPETDYPGSYSVQQATGQRTLLATPLLREGAPVGVIVIRRITVRPFADKQIALLKTFADQAVIAIENARLFQELQEQLEQQTATAEILRVINASPGNLRPVANAIVERSCRLCGADIASFRLVEGDTLRLIANHWGDPPADVAPEDWRRLQRVLRVGQILRLGGRSAARQTRAFTERRTNYEPDVRASRGEEHVGSRGGLRAIAEIPLMRDGTPVGMLVVRSFRPRAFSKAHLTLLETFADQAVIALENARLFQELEDSNRALTEQKQHLQEALEQQTAAADILRVIASSPTDLQKVLDTIARTAARLCAAADAAILRSDGATVLWAAHYGDLPSVAPGVPGGHNRGYVAGRAMVDRATVHVHDMLAEREEDYPGSMTTARAHGFRTYLAVPLLHKRAALGALFIRRTEVRPFTDQQITLLETFADQAVIALENARLFAELQDRLEEQTATAEILRAIAGSPTDLQPVLEAVAETAARVCGADDAMINRVEGETLPWVAHHGPIPVVPSILPFDRGSPSGRAAVDGRAVHVHDIASEGDDEFPWTRANWRRGGQRWHTMLAVPLLRQDAAVGAITIRREAVKPFTDRQIALLQSFADQAVIAIENARLFSELQESNRELTEALEQQTATAQVLEAISRAPTDLQRVLDTIADSAARLCGTERAVIWRVEGDACRPVAGISGLFEDRQYTLAIESASESVYPLALARDVVPGRAIADGVVVHVPDLAAEPEEALPAPVARARGVRTQLAVPMLRQGVAIGAITLARREVRPFTEQQVRLLETFADQAVIALENARLFTELQDRNRALTEALAQQTATADVLRVIASSPTDLEGVLAAIARTVTHLCEADAVYLERFRDGQRHEAAYYSITGEARLEPRRGAPDPGLVSNRAVLEARTIHVPDMAIESDAEWPGSRDVYRRQGVRTFLGAPLLRAGAAIGAIALHRKAPRPFTGPQIKLLDTFADQAVIAMENARLFQELRARVGELQALGEVTQAVSSTLELETVLARIVAHAQRLSGADGGAIFEYDEAADAFRPRSAEQLEAALAAALRDVPLRLGQGAVGRAAATRAPVQVPDILAEGAYRGHLLDALVQAGSRALLAVPLLREDRVLGGLVVSRRTPGAFPDEVVALLQTFASQSALAIQNARLFSEIEAQSRQLEVASRHKSEFLAAMSHELRTPLNAVIGFSEVLIERLVGDLNERQEAYLEDIRASGRHLLALINDILDLSKVEAGRMELELEPFSLAGALEDGLTMVREEAGRRGVALGLEVDPGLGPVEADARKVKQVVFNLLANAVKFTPAGGRVDVAAGPAGPAGGEVRVAVRDTGVGVAPEDRERIFEAFHQAGRPGAAGGSAAPPPREGTGLGLALARRFVELHGGRLWVESAPGAGSTFTFTLPRHRGPPATEAPAAAATAAGDGGAGAAHPRTGPTVLLVDDDPRTVELLTLYLGGAGFEVVVARDGEEALALARRVRPAVITLDVLLPRLDGWEVLARAKADPALAGVPVVVVSMLDERGKGFALGAAEYLVKPVGREALLGALRRLLPPADAAAGPSPAQAAGAAGAAPTVLAIDDDPLAVELLRATLGAEGYRVVAAAGGEAGVALARREAPALVILDLLMPEVDGFAVVERLRADPATAAVPIVILTAKTMTAADKARLNGRISFLAAKSAFSRAGFVELVRRLCPGPEATARVP
jgi:GAF domain-containing protein/DNA-binding response OmpR family regulator